MASLPITEGDRIATSEALAPRQRSPILRHGFWLLPSAAAALLAFSYMQKEPEHLPNASNATLGGASDSDLLPQNRTGFATFEFGDTLGQGVFARIEFYATELDDDPLFTTGQITESRFQLSPLQKAKLEGLERVWVVVEWVQPAGHSRSSAGQWWDR